MDDFFPIAQLKMKGFTLREKCLNTELFLVRILLYSVRIQENIDQTQLHILDSFHAVSVCHSYMTEVVEGGGLLLCILEDIQSKPLISKSKCNFFSCGQFKKKEMVSAHITCPYNPHQNLILNILNA